MKLFSNPLALSVIGTDTNVLYSCECQEFKPITKLYFCRHCIKLRCEKCVTHEVDSFYCPNCLENMPSAEAKLKKNRCANCFDCPSCSHTLSVRATAVPNSSSNSSEEKTVPPKKMHYLNCGFCRWTTRDVGLPDQVTPSGGWPDLELPFTKKLMAMTDYYKHVAHQDKVDKERQKISKRRTNMYLMDRYGYALSLGKKRAGSIGSSSMSPFLSRTNSSGAPKEVHAPVVAPAINELEVIPDSFYTEPLILEEALTLDQKLKEPGVQGDVTKQLYPKHKHLKVRRSQRCKGCEHNLCKPEFNPSSIKFKIQLGAIQYCPILQIVQKGNLSKDEESEFIFSVTNPLDAIIIISFKRVEEDETKTAEITLPQTTLAIAAKDATVEFDGIGTSTADTFDDDPKVVHSRTSNKVCLYANIKPLMDTGDVTVKFHLMYEYKMFTTPLVRKIEDGKDGKPEEHLVSLTILVQTSLGEINQTLL